MPKLSIITPVYNGKRFMEFCVKSVLQQYCPEVEHIIVDGGSTDGTVEIIKKYAEKHSHIRWVSEKDDGQSEAMNKGIRMTRGELIGILNTDDYYEPKVFSLKLQIFETLPDPTLLVGNCNIWDCDGKLHSVNRPRNLHITDLMLGWHVNPFPVNPSAYFYHKSLHEKTGLYDRDDHYSMDLDFLLKAVMTANVQYVDETFGNFRQIEGTKTFDAIKTGKSAERNNHLMDKYFRKLPIWQRWKINILKHVLRKPNYSLMRIIHYLSHPGEIILLCRKKIRGLCKG